MMKHEYSDYTSELNGLSITEINERISEIDKKIADIEDELMVVPERSRIANSMMKDIIRLQKKKSLCRDEIIKKKRHGITINGKALKYGLYTDADNRNFKKQSGGISYSLRGVTL